MVYGWDPNNFVQQGKEEICSLEFVVNTKMKVSAAVYSTDRTPLPDKWKVHNYKMFINNRPVNLDALGPIDTTESPLGCHVCLECGDHYHRAR